MDEDKFRKGTWTDDEHNKYLLGYEKFGKDWKAIEGFVGTRSKQQISMHHRHYTLKTTGAVPESNRKRKNEEGGSTPKKTKSSSVESSKKATAKPKATPSKKVTTKLATKPETISVAEDKASTSKGNDILPPAKAPSTSPVKLSETVAKPEKVDPVVKDFAAQVIEDAMSAKSRVLEFLRREEVQTVVAGVVGFLAVVVVKKLLG